MRSPARMASTFSLGLLIAVAFIVLGQRGPSSSTLSAQASTDATQRIVSAAHALLKTLDESGRAKVQFPFEGPQKTKWSNLPTPMFPREGLRMGDLTPAQRAAAMSLISTALSKDGYRKVTEIIGGDEVLRKGQKPGARVTFGEDEYYLAFLGTPSTTSPWMLQFGGHHLAINLTMAGNQATMAPSLPAAQPATYTIEGRTIRPLGKENDKAFALINALNDDQRKPAIIGSRVVDLVLGPGKDGQTIQPEGVRASALSAPQQTMLLDLVREWAGIMNDGFADPRMVEIKANLPQTYFAWSGPTTNGSAAYFRIQGPTLVIEYAPQQDSVDHIHTIYRDPTNDYGAKLTRK
jgi:Protein of unknown function (DUF3500)